MNRKLDLLKQGLLRVPHDLGVPGIASAALLAAAALFHFGVVKPLQARDAEAAQRVARQAPRAQPGEPASSADKLAAVYQHLSKDESPTDWLAKLSAIGSATGLELKSAAYKQQADGRIVHYEIVLPISGSYAQIRDFLARARAEVPAMSVDQLTLRREKRTDATLRAELRLTLHMVKS
ncbi:MAG: GspMb/PilO family protein [Burkholderiales bacterium]